MEINESELTFTFASGTQAIKFDDTNFYRHKYNKQPEGKGVDIIASNSECLQLIEIKNCTDHESENLWRTSVNNSKANSAPTNSSGEPRDSLDIEVAKKVASTMACLYGAWTKHEKMGSANELMSLGAELNSKKIPNDQKPIVVILFLEGNFEITGSKTRNKKMIMQRLQSSIRDKLVWLNCKVSVVDSATYQKRYFEVS